jgi:1-acyl-sn-glycerol-3-phosphate acyltransferase
MAWLIDERVRERVRRLEIPWSRHGVDPYGATQDDMARTFSMLGVLYRRYFQVTVSGLEHLPRHGRGMIIGNHSGGWALDALMIMASVFFELEPPRLAQGMVEKFILRLPFSGASSHRSGHMVGVPENAVRLLHDERLLLVFPEGARGTAKLFKERNSLVRFGTGFMRLAMEARAPIIPVGFVGGGEAIPSIVNLYRLGRLVGVPYIPVTPYLLALPLPVALHIEYGEPMMFPGTGNEPDDVIAENVGQVKERITTLIDRGLEVRRIGASLLRRLLP